MLRPFLTTMRWFILVSSLVLLQGTTSEAKALPRGLAEFLRRMGVSLPDQQVSDRSTLSNIQYDDTRTYQFKSDVPEHSSGVITTKLNNPAYNPKDAYCKPRPTAVRIPKHPGITSYPDYVILQQCTGSCSFTQDSEHCTVTKQDEINVNIYEIIGSSLEIKLMSLFNHTACDCDCIKSQSDCNSTIQKWNQDACKCECLSVGACNATTQSWDDQKCECHCKLAQQTCNHNKEWDFKSCGCHCKQGFKDICTGLGMDIKPDNCECI